MVWLIIMMAYRVVQWTHLSRKESCFIYIDMERWKVEEMYFGSHSCINRKHSTEKILLKFHSIKILANKIWRENSWLEMNYNTLFWIFESGVRLKFKKDNFTLSKMHFEIFLSSAKKFIFISVNTMYTGVLKVNSN